MLTWIFTDLIVQCRTLRSKKSLFPYINSGGYYLRSVIIPLDRVRFVCCPLELASTFFLLSDVGKHIACSTASAHALDFKYILEKKRREKI